jgi:hypothetical protein
LKIICNAKKEQYGRNNIRIVLCINYNTINNNIIIIIIIYYFILIQNNNNNNPIFNNNCGRLQELILLRNISMGMQKNFFEVYRKFGHVPLKKFCQSQYRRLGESGWVWNGLHNSLPSNRFGNPRTVKQ